MPRAGSGTSDIDACALAKFVFCVCELRLETFAGMRENRLLELVGTTGGTLLSLCNDTGACGNSHLVVGKTAGADLIEELGAPIAAACEFPCPFSSSGFIELLRIG
jgi:hypothetical protein